MTDQRCKAEQFRELHIPGKPLILFNIWDAGSVKGVANAGAKAIATGSWSAQPVSRQFSRYPQFLHRIRDSLPARLFVAVWRSGLWGYLEISRPACACTCSSRFSRACSARSFACST